jgi:transposase
LRPGNGGPTASGSTDHSRVKARRPELARSRISLYYLPAYGPELNEIEPLFKRVKHHEIPVRSHKSKAERREAVEQGFATYGDSVRQESSNQLRSAA